MGYGSIYAGALLIPMAQVATPSMTQTLAIVAAVAVLGSKAARPPFPGRPMVGEAITIVGTEFRIVGAVEKISR